MLEPETPLEISWHHELIAEYLTLIACGELRRFVLNMPPQHMKSRLVTVIWPCWMWARESGSAWIFSSYSAELSKLKHSPERRAILESEWFRSHWPRVEIAEGQNRQDEYQNTKGGRMSSTSTAGAATGKGADIIVVDDPLDPRRALSETERKRANDHFDLTLWTRQRNTQTSVFVIVMHRLHDGDLTGHVQEHKLDVPWTVLSLPAEIPVGTAAETVTFPISGRVVERKPGDRLWPSRDSEAALNDAKRVLGSWGFSGQYQQNPAPLGGGIFKRIWWHYYGGTKPCPRCLLRGQTVIHGAPPRSLWTEAWQSWDMAFKDLKDSDHVAGHAYARVGADLYMLDRVNDVMSFVETCQAVRTFSGKWPMIGGKLVEEAANGPAVISALKHEVGGFVGVDPEGGKIARAYAASPTAEGGNVYLPEESIAPWVMEFVDTMARFPKATYDDDVDAFTQAVKRMILHSPSAEVWIQYAKDEVQKGSKERNLKTVRERV